MVLQLYGCGTIQTLSPKDGHVEISYLGKRSYCKNIPRIYSGTSLQLCKLYGQPNYDTTLDQNVTGVPYFIIDIPLSFISDTLLIPYTGFMQYKKGKISVN